MTVVMNINSLSYWWALPLLSFQSIFALFLDECKFEAEILVAALHTSSSSPFCIFSRLEATGFW